MYGRGYLYVCVYVCIICAYVLRVVETVYRVCARLSCPAVATRARYRCRNTQAPVRHTLTKIDTHTDRPALATHTMLMLCSLSYSNPESHTHATGGGHGGIAGRRYHPAVALQLRPILTCCIQFRNIEYGCMFVYVNIL